MINSKIIYLLAEHGALMMVGQGHSCNDDLILTLRIYLSMTLKSLIMLGHMSKLNCISQIYLEIFMGPNLSHPRLVEL